MPDEDVLLRRQPSMWRTHPIWFTACILLIPAYGVGLVILGIWWLVTYNRELVVTKARSRKRTGILANETTELEHQDVKNIQIQQGAIHSLTGVGTLRLSSAGQAGMELSMHGIQDPEGVRDLVYGQRE